MGNNNDAALRKRQQIDSSKRTMFIAVAVVAFVSGVALVVSFFLVQQIILHGRVISEKQKTVNTIAANIAAVEDLKDSIRVLDTNEALMSARSSEDSSALQVVLDALPTEANTDALGASLQVRFVGAVDGLTLESLFIEDQGVTDASGAEAEEATVADEGGEEADGDGIGFTMTVSGPAESLKALLARFERSIRVIKVDSIEIEAGTDGRLTMNLSGRAYYQPAKIVQLGEKVVKP